MQGRTETATKEKKITDKLFMIILCDLSTISEDINSIAITNSKQSDR